MKVSKNQIKLQKQKNLHPNRFQIKLVFSKPAVATLHKLQTQQKLTLTHKTAFS